MRGGLLLTCLAAIAALALPASASAAVSCNLAAGTLIVNVTGSGDQVASLKMLNGGSEIGVFSDLPSTVQQACNVNPVPAVSTDTIVVADSEPGSSQRTLAQVDFQGGPFLNGTAEGGGDQEIEIVIDGGDESQDDLILDPGPGPVDDNWRMGDLSVLPADEGVSLNDAETGTADVDDIHALNMDQFQVGTDGNGGDDILDARGGAGFTGPMTMTSSVKQLVAGDGDDQIFAGEGSGWRVEGDLGADTMVGGGGDDFMQASFGTDADTIDGNGGTDNCSFLNHNTPVRVDLNVTGPQDTLGAGVDTFSDCEGLSGGDGGDTLIGDAGPNTIFGGPGNDTVRPGPGGAGDTVDGGPDADTVDYSDVAPTGATVSLATAAAQNTGYGMDTISNTENVIGTPFTDTLTGNAQVNRIVGGDGVDDIDLGDNHDFFDSYDAVADNVDCGDGNDSGIASEPGVDALANCETTDFAPNTTVANGPADAAVIDDATPTYDLTASEGGVAFELSVDGGPFAACAASCQVPALSDGAHTLRFRAVESAGVLHADPTPAQRTVTVDTTTDPPATDTTPPDTVAKKPRVKGDTAKLRFTSTEAGSSFTCKLDRKKAKQCKSPQRYRKLAPGKHKVIVTAIDKAGNADPQPAKVKFKVE